MDEFSETWSRSRKLATNRFYDEMQWKLLTFVHLPIRTSYFIRSVIPAFTRFSVIEPLILAYFQRQYLKNGVSKIEYFYFVIN